MDGLLRALRRPGGTPGAGRPSGLARVVAALLVLGMVGVAAPVLVLVLGPVLRWLASVLL